MNTNDFFSKLSSNKISENFQRQFGSKIKLEKYTREELEDMRNKLRTKIFQHEHTSGYNDLLTNEAYQKDMAMLQLLNTRIKEMLGEDIKKLKDKMIELSEGKKGVKTAKHPQGSKSSTKDYDGDGKIESPKDEVWGSRAKAAAKAGKPFEESAKPDFLDMDKDGDKKEPMKKAVADKKVKEDDDRKPAKKQEREVELPSGAKVKATKVQGWQSQKADKAADKERKSYDKDVSETADRPAAKKKETTWTDKSGKQHPATRVQGSKSVAADKDADKERKSHDKDMSEAKDECNHTPKGKKCPVHGLKECGSMYEGKDEGKPGKGFSKMVKKLTPKHGKASAQKIVGAQHEKMKKAGQLEEAQQVFKQHVRLVNESLAYYIAEDEEGKAKAITAASDIVNDFTSWMQRVGQYQTKAIIELADAIKADFGAAEAETFKQAVAPALAATLETLTSQREVISGAVAALAGEAPAAPPMGAEPDMASDMEPAMPDEMNPPEEPTGDEFGAADAASTGREVRESRFSRRLAESHSIMSKLAR